MKLFLYNTLTRRREIFRPIDGNLIKMYVCGPTVYDNPHIGNARSSTVYDVLYRLLCQVFGANQVKYVRNITDVDDKIIERSQESGANIDDLTAHITKIFHDNMWYLGCKSPNVEPKATEHIEDMIMIIEKLLNSGHAYIADHHVYFDVASHKDYTFLSNRNIDKLLVSVRVDNSPSKKHPQDFILWKPARSGDPISAIFDSPWGPGRPGWHIECSAMSYKYLGENFDIHGGGADLIFPHHTNEIAQSSCAFPNSKFANYWVHNGFLTCNGEKMSKSLGNFITVQDFIDKQVPGDIVRLFLLSSHYRKPLDYNEKALEDARKTINYWYRVLENNDINDVSVPDDFMNALLDDLNTPLAVKIINDYAKLVFSSDDEQEKVQSASYVRACANFVGLMHQSPSEWFHHAIDERYIDQLIATRTQAKADKQWKLADDIRNRLLKEGIVLEDHQTGTTTWRRM